MASPTVPSTGFPCPQVIAEAFVQHYFQILLNSPNIIPLFYHESSSITRPDTNGMTKSVTTVLGLQAIKDMVLSLDYYEDCTISIETIKSELTEKKGVLILVTGCLNQRKFHQTFVLAPKGSGAYFVLNDIFRFMDVLESSVIPYQEKGDAVREEVLYDVSASIKPSLTEPVSEVACSLEKESVEPSLPEAVSEVTCSVEKEKVPYFSYASIVKATGITLAVPVNIPTVKASPDPSMPTKLASAPDRPLSTVTNTAPATQPLAKVEGYSVFVRNLPLNIRANHIEMELKKFGPIKPDGIQVRRHQVERKCFAFVEFQSFKSMQEAIRASPINIADNEACVYKKRRRQVRNGDLVNGSSRGSNPSGSGGLRTDNSFGNGGFRANSRSGKNDFINHGSNSSSSQAKKQGSNSAPIQTKKQGSNSAPSQARGSEHRDPAPSQAKNQGTNLAPSHALTSQQLVVQKDDDKASPVIQTKGKDEKVFEIEEGWELPKKPIRQRTTRAH